MRNYINFQKICEKIKKLFILLLFITVFILVMVWIIQKENFFLYELIMHNQKTQKVIVEENSEGKKAYKKEMARNLKAMKDEYQKYQESGNERQKNFVVATIIYHFKNFPESELPPDLGAFLKRIKKEENISN